MSQQATQQSETYGVDRILGQSPMMSRLKELVLLYASSNAPVLIYGESGSGKELVARAIYKHSPRAGNIFIAKDLNTVPQGTIESALFGAEKGSYTDAFRRTEGLFYTANGGVLFLDEIQNLSLETQVKLLRVLEEGRYERVGGAQTLNTDVRLITATSRNLEQLMRQEKFDEGLFYRIRVLPLQISPLRDRGDDTILLAKHYCSLFSEQYKKSLSISPDGEKYLLEQPWYGNIRELKHFIETAVIIKKIIKTEGETLGESDFKRVAELYGFNTLSSFSGEVREVVNIKPLAVAERDYIRAVVDMCGGNISKAAELLKISRQTIRKKLNESVPQIESNS